MTLAQRLAVLALDAIHCIGVVGHDINRRTAFPATTEAVDWFLWLAGV